MSGLPLVGYSIFNGLAPRTKMGPDNVPLQGPRVICTPLVFTASKNVVLLEFFQENQDHQLDFIQTVKVNNAASALALTIAVSVTQDFLIIPAGKSAILPLMTSDSPKITITKLVVGADEAIMFYWTNIAMASIVW